MLTNEQNQSTQGKSPLQKLMQPLSNGVRYLAAAVARIFSPNERHYPATGIQPYEGEPPEQDNR